MSIFGDDQITQQPTGVFGKVQEANQFLKNMEPENAQALLVAGLQLMQGAGIGQAGMAALATRNDERDRLFRQGDIQNRTRIAAANSDIAAANARTAMDRQDLAVQREDRIANQPLSGAGKALSDYQAILDRYGADSKEAKDFLTFSETQGLGLDFNDDGTLKGIRFGRGAGNAGDLTNTNVTRLQEQLYTAQGMYDQIKGLRESVAESSPFDFGTVGAIREELGGYFGQFGAEGLERSIAPSGSVRPEARAIALHWGRRMIDEGRITGSERQELERTMAILNSSGSKRRALEALDVMMGIFEANYDQAGEVLGGGQSGSKNVDAVEAALRAAEGR